MSPPERESRPGGNRAASSSATATDSSDIPCQLRRRRAESRRLPGGDPWRYEPPTEGYEAAAQHLLELGLAPSLNCEALQAMRRRGGRSLRAAKLIAQRWDGAA